MIESKLTIKQQGFADAFIELGNATKAYMQAYPNVKKEATAKAAGSRLLTNVNVKAYIDERMRELASERVATQQEVLETLTAILRGETTAATLKSVDVGVQEIEENMPPTMSERIKAAELIGKRHRMWVDRVESDNTEHVVIVDDV